ncbi:MAG: glycerate kinase [Actinomycetota bacterium]
MRVVVAPNAFKGCLTAKQAAEAIARGVKAGGHEPVLAPVADGGDGTLDALVAGVGGTVMGTIARGPLGLPVRAHVGILSDGTGVVEMAQASGLMLVPAGDRAPMRATSYGTGELMRAALARRPGRIIMALGGSATVDGGTGIGRALGLRFLDDEGKQLPDGGGPLERLARIDNTKLDPRVTATPIVIASDVTNPLLGSEGAARMFGPQKGANPEQVEALERGLTKLAERLKADLGADVAERPGAGAAGGTGAMLMALGASLRSGVEVVLEALRFSDLLNSADLVITGEGKLDRQTLAGKAPLGVAKAAAEAGVPCAAIVGASEIEPEEAGMVAVRSLVDHFGDPARAMAKADAGLATLAASLVRSFASARTRP